MGSTRIQRTPGTPSQSAGGSESGALTEASSVTTPGSFDGTVATAADILAVLANPAGNAGKTYEVQPGTYSSLGTITAQPTADITFIGKAGSESSIIMPALTFSQARHLAFNGMRIPAGVGLDRAQFITLKRAKLIGAGLGMNGASDITIDQIEIGNTTGGGCMTIAPHFASTTTCSRISVKRSKFHDPNQDGILLQCGTDILLEDVEVYNVIENGQHNDGIVLDTGPSVPSSIEAVNLTLRRCYVHDGNMQGIAMYGDAINTLVEDCLLVRTETSGQSVLIIAAQKGAIVRNCTAWNNGSTDLSLREFVRADGQQSTLLQLYNNVFDKWYYAPGATAAANTLRRDHNLLGPHTFSTSAVTANYEEDLGAAPAFINTATDDYRLAAARTVVGASGSQTYTPGITWRPADQSYGAGW